MIFVARLLSLIGVTIMIFGFGTIFIMMVFDLEPLLPDGTQDYWLLPFIVTSFGIALLVLGQRCGNDLFKVRGKGSVFALDTRSNSRNDSYLGGGGHDIGGDGGSWD